MALYDFHCVNCGEAFEVSQPIKSENRQHPCPVCRSNKTRRLFTNPPAVVYKTDGFYHIDSGKRFESQLSKRGKEIWDKAKVETKYV